MTSTQDRLTLDDLSSVDLFNPDNYVEGMPHDQLTLLRTAAPVFHHPDPWRPQGHWAITRHADVMFVSRNPEIFSSERETCFLRDSPADRLPQQRLMMLNMDPPGHTRLRSLVNRGFTPRMIGKLEERIAGACDDIVRKAVEQREGDFVTMCAAELPLVVIAELLGVPHEDRHKLFHWSNLMLSGDDPEVVASPEVQAQTTTDVYAYANALGASKRECPVDDIVSKLISPDDDGSSLTELEFDLFFVLLMVAGNETTRNAISGGIQAFVENPDQWQLLKSRPELISSAADEIVRWVTPVVDFRRTTMRDVEVGGTLIREGEKVIIYYASANRDESVFTDPFRFDITRDPNPHIGFGGGGPHFCLGRHLAKLEIERMLAALITHVDTIEITGPVRRLRSHFINGIKSMPVRLTPADGS
jgi:cholest-4-en-3-one 26-monooxygenase